MRRGIKHAVEEGLLLADRAARLDVRNRIEVATIGRNQEYRAEAFGPDALAALETLAAEQDGVADRLESEAKAVRRRWGVALGQHDYRRGDRRNLLTRARVARALAEAIRERARDDAYIADLIERARQDAWSDVAGVIRQNLDISERPPERPSRARAKRIDDLAAEIRKLAERRGGLGP